MRMMKLSTARGGVFLAFVAVSVGLAPAANSAELVYENDFAVRTSAEPHSSVWATYEYDKGGPLAYDYDSGVMSDRYTGMYPWQGIGSGLVPYSQQDGWYKKTTGYSRYVNRGCTSVTDEADPALIYSAMDSENTNAVNMHILVQHPLHNVFTNGIVKFQFDIRQPVSPTGRIFSWLRLVTEIDMKNDNNFMTNMPIEVGLSSSSFSGGWRNDGDADGKRTFQNYTGYSVRGGNWYRYYVTCNLDTSRSSFEAYDLGASRISMDEMPSGDPVWSRSNLLFAKELDDKTGGISGIGIRLAYVNTANYYGEAGFNADPTYMYDNIKVAWKAPSEFEECYRNDFSKSMRRTVDGSSSTSHAYTIPAEEETETSTFTYPDELVRASDVGTQTGKPYLPAAMGTAGQVQKAGIDGWRFVGQTGGFNGAIALTTNGSNRVGMLTKYAQVIQPMCEDITNGIVKMEWDMRTPKAWNASTARSSIILTSNKGYDEGYEFGYQYRLMTLGLCSTNGSGNSSAPIKSFSVMNSSSTTYTASYNKSWASKFKALEWYRFQLFIDLDKTNYWFYVYDIGSSSPATPGSFTDSNDPANAIVSGVTNGLTIPASGTYAGQGYEKYGVKVGAYGFVAWNNPDSDADYAILVDNVRCWKGDGNDGWDLVFQNDFSTAKRTFKRKSLKLLNTRFIDRPEYGEDGWTAAPTYVGSSCIAGTNPSLYSGDDIFSIVHPIGRIIKHGKLYAQYDMRVPVFWTSRMYYFWFQFGNGAIASASTWTSTAYRYQNHRTIRTGMQRGGGGSGPLVDSNTGVPNRTAIIYQDGTGTGGDGTLRAKHIDQNYVGHWIRVKIEADMKAKTWNWASYDMGTAQPSLATADGTLLDSYDNLKFNFNEPISHIHIIGGRAPSYMPWRDDAPGALMVDNIRICHEASGMTILVR